MHCYSFVVPWVSLPESMLSGPKSFHTDIEKFMFWTKASNSYLLIIISQRHRSAHYENMPIQIYWEFYHQKWKFSDEKFWYFFLISAQNIDCSNEYPQSMFLSRKKKNNVYRCKPQFYYIKMGFMGVKIIYTCFRDWDVSLRKLKNWPSCNFFCTCYLATALGFLAECGVWSGSPLFANSSTIFL